MIHDKTIKNSKILIIDDNKVMRMMLRQIFAEQGFENIEEAVNGQDGWEQTLVFQPDIVLLDIEMPIMNGFEYCIKARENPDFKKMVILVQTGLTGMEEKKKIFSCGATDYVSKPIETDELLARSIVHLNNTRYLKQLEELNNQFSTEMQSAKRLVDISLPNELLINDIKDRTGLEIFSYFQSSFEIGGDFWDLQQIDETKVGIYVVDFSGHGVNSALNATRLDCLIKSSPDRATDPATFMHWLNNNLYSLLPPEQYATMFYGVIDIQNNTLCYATAACPEMLILRNNANNTEFIDGSGFPLGTIKEATYHNKTIPFNQNDILMLYSDALIETEDSSGNFLSNIQEYFLKNYKGKTPELLRECFDLFIYNFMNDYGENISDDLTVVLCCIPEKN